MIDTNKFDNVESLLLEACKHGFKIKFTPKWIEAKCDGFYNDEYYDDYMTLFECLKTTIDRIQVDQNEDN